jgi:hypothetical protein
MKFSKSILFSLLSALTLMASCNQSVELQSGDQSSVDQTGQSQSDNPSSGSLGDVDIRVALISEGGDVKPVARHDFMVMPFCIGDLREKHKPGTSPENKAAYENELESLYEQAQMEGQVFQAKTNLDGEISLQDMPEGNYCVSNDSIRTESNEWEAISGNQQIMGCYVYWSVNFSVEPESVTEVELSNDNVNEKYPPYCPS